MATAVVEERVTLTILPLVLQVVVLVEKLAIKPQALLTQAEAAVVLVGLRRKQAPQVVQVTHELLIGVNYGTTLCIS
jgi:hypothetical protein